MIILIWIIIAVFIEAVTEILISSDIFLGFRNWFAKRDNFACRFIGDLLRCGYCTSVWCSAAIAWAAPGELTGIAWIDIAIKIFALHRLANVIHELFQRWFDRHPWVIVLQTDSSSPVDNDDRVIEVDDG